MILEFTGVSAEEVEIARGFLERSGFTGFMGETGRAAAECTVFDFHWEPTTGALRIDVSKLPTELTNLRPENAHAKFTDLVRVALGRAGVLGDRCGVYNYVRPKISNRSGGVLTYSRNTTSHGTVGEVVTGIEIDAEVQAFEAASSKGSGVGAEGTVIYLLADGNTELNLQYWLNGAGMHSFNAGLTGQNAPRYKVDVKDTNPWVDGYTYLAPTVTISQR